jgi:hypothetical protein
MGRGDQREAVTGYTLSVELTTTNRGKAIMQDDLTRRAFAAWFRAGNIEQPASTSGVREHEGKYYVVLENVNGTLAVYRVRNDEKLKRLRRWPQEVAERR